MGAERLPGPEAGVPQPQLVHSAVLVELEGGQAVLPHPDVVQHVLRQLAVDLPVAVGHKGDRAEDDDLLVLRIQVPLEVGEEDRVVALLVVLVHHLVALRPLGVVRRRRVQQILRHQSVFFPDGGVALDVEVLLQQAAQHLVVLVHDPQILVAVVQNFVL